MDDITTIVLTGGPGAGKSMVSDALRIELAGIATFVPEAATLLLSGGFPSPSREVSYIPDWLDCFQRAISLVQVELEQAYLLEAQENNHRLMILDRGLLDGVAFLGDECHWAELTGLDPATALRRYDHVIHLTSLAVTRPELYGNSGNKHRRENLAESAALCFRIQQAWSAHPSLHLIENNGTAAELIGKVRSTIGSLIDIHIQSMRPRTG